MFARPGVALGSLYLAGLILGDGADRLLRPARREPRRLLRHAEAEPPDGLDVRRVPRLLELRLARQAQRRAPHVHERGRLRRRHQPGAVRAPDADQAPKPWYRLQHIYIWPLYSLMVLRWQTGADVAALVPAASARARSDRRGAGTSPAWSAASDLHRVGDRRAAARLPVVGRRCAGYLGFAMATSLITATTFQLAHCVEEADFASVDS